MWFRLLRLMIFLLLSTSGFACQPAGLPTANASPKIDVSTEILYYVNQYRASLHKPPLQLLPVVSTIAAVHSSNMAMGRTPFGHQGFDGRWIEILKAEPTMKAMGENVAFGKISAKEVVDLWIQSAGHRKNLEGDFNYTGIGIAAAKDRTLYFTEIYIRK